MKSVKLDDIMAKLNLDYNSREFKMGMALAGVMVIVGYLYFFIIPLASDAIRYSGKAHGFKTDISQVEDALTREGALKKKLKDMSDKVGSYEKKLPSEHEIPMFLEYVSETAKRTGVKILGISPLPSLKSGETKTGKKPYQEIPISVTARSGYHELGAFINSLENGDRFTKINTVRISSGTASKRLHEVELGLSTYMLLKE